MATIEDIYKAIEQDKMLCTTLRGIGSKGFSTQQIADAMAAAGIEAKPDQVEELLQILQQKRADELSQNEVDLDQLEMVAGGGSGVDCSNADDCNSHFKNPDYWDSRCNFFRNCDEYALSKDPDDSTF